MNGKKTITQNIDQTNWKKHDPKGSPFLDYRFFKALEESGSIGGESGWDPLYFEDGESLLYTFAKSHSYGEYIFDWDWAHAYHSHKIPYYPKLTSMIPVTSATTPHWFGRPEKVFGEYQEFYKDKPFTSSHFLFLTESELAFFKGHDYAIRESFQYHFHNEGYRDFGDFLSALKNKKAKQIKKERDFDGLHIERLSGDQLTKKHAEEMLDCYLSTIQLKNAIPYLTKEFFLQLFEKQSDQICFVRATRNEKILAGALFLFGHERLYGRYWGAFDDVPNLHFELCYYQGIELCLEKKLSVFEAGAQGEHKIARGFRPVRTYSAHHLKHPQFHAAIVDYVEKEKKAISMAIEQLEKRLPFKLSTS